LPPEARSTHPADGGSPAAQPSANAQAGEAPGRIALLPQDLNANGMFIAAWRKA
jgi:hypothetical protein